MNNSVIFTTDHICVAKRIDISATEMVFEVKDIFDFEYNEIEASELTSVNQKENVVIPIKASNLANENEHIKYEVEFTNPNKYFVFSEEQLLSKDTTAKIFKTHKRKFNQPLMIDLSIALSEFLDGLNDLTDKNGYEILFFNNNSIEKEPGYMSSKRFVSWYAFIKNLKSMNSEILCSKELSCDIDDLKAFSREYVDSINKNLLKALSSIYKVKEDDLTVEIEFSEGKETYNKSILYKEMIDEIDKPYIKEALKKALEII